MEVYIYYYFFLGMSVLRIITILAPSHEGLTQTLIGINWSKFSGNSHEEEADN